MDQHVALGDHAEDVALAARHLLQPRLRDAGPRLELEVRTLELGQLHEIGHAEHRPGHVDVGRVHVELFLDQLPDRLRHRPVDLEPDGLGRSLALPEDRLDRGQEVVGLVDLQVEVQVARDPERVHRHDLHPREQHVEVGGDHLFLRDETFTVGQRQQARDVRRHLHAREPADLRRRVARDDGEVQRQVGDVREGVRRIHRQRRQDREHALLERLAQMDAVVAAPGPPSRRR